MPHFALLSRVVAGFDDVCHVLSHHSGATYVTVVSLKRRYPL